MFGGGSGAVAPVVVASLASAIVLKEVVGKKSENERSALFGALGSAELSSLGVSLASWLTPGFLTGSKWSVTASHLRLSVVLRLGNYRVSAFGACKVSVLCSWRFASSRYLAASLLFCRRHLFGRKVGTLRRFVPRL